MNLIITSGSGRHFVQLKNFVISLRTNGRYTGHIAICDNAVEGKWNEPGTWSREASFDDEQISFFKKNDVKVYPFHQLLIENSINESVISNIKSPTQRYPFKFVYNVLISKKYLNKVKSILYFDSDIYFQAPVASLFQEVEDGKVLIVKEWLKMQESPHLRNWLLFSDFSKLSMQEDYKNQMLAADNFCSGFYGSTAQHFHKFNLLALMLTSNQFINFYSDQPLINILKTFFALPFKEIDWKFCLHLGELPSYTYTVKDNKFVYNEVVPLSVHFNCGKYKELENVLEGAKHSLTVKTPVYRKILRKIQNQYKRIFQPG